MYSIELSKISLDEFKEIMLSIELLPGRRIMPDNLAEVIERLKQKGITHLDALRKLLQNKKQYPELTETLLVSVDYLVILNREINGYISKPLQLSALDVFSAAELEKLEKAGIKSTRDFYEQSLSKTARQELSARLSLPAQQIILALELADLLRINGVGPTYARILHTIGVKSVSDYLRYKTDEILEKYKKANNEKQFTRVNLGEKDIEYCKRFCRKLDIEIEW
jgi:hypothetical protein